MKTSRAKRDTVALAGWLYADLLLGMAMLFLLFGTVGTPILTVTPYTLTPVITPSATATKTPTSTTTPIKQTVAPPSSTPTPSPTPTNTYTPTPSSTPERTGGLSPNPEEIQFQVNIDLLLANNQAETQRVRNIINSQLGNFSNRRAGIVITFGTTLSRDPQKGQELAETINDLLRSTLPDTFRNTVFKDFHNLTLRQDYVGIVNLEISWGLER